MLTVSCALFLSIKRIRCWTQKKPPSLCYQSGGLTIHGDILFEAYASAPHIDQQQRAVDQGTLASPSQVAAPKRALLMHGGETSEELNGEQVGIVS